MRARNFRVGLAIIIFLAGSVNILNLSAGSSADDPADKQPRLLIFHSFSCHSCLKAKNELVPKIEREFQGKIRIEYRDVADIENYKQLLGLEEKYKVSLKNTLPVFYISGRFLNGEGSSKSRLRR